MESRRKSNSKNLASMTLRRITLVFSVLLTFSLGGLVACGTTEEPNVENNSNPDDKKTETPQTNNSERPKGWEEASHGKDGTPNYSKIFDTTKVHRFDVTISAADWKTMFDDMTKRGGEFGSRKGNQGGGRPGGPGGGQGGKGDRPPQGSPPQELIDACKDKQDGATCEATLNGQKMTGKCTKDPRGSDVLCFNESMMKPPGGGGPGGGQGGKDKGNLIDGQPVYIPCTLKYDGKTWNYVGIRLKGNSSLASSWGSGSYKLPFRLKMDHFEDKYPAIKNQRFHGFKKLSMGNGFSDNSLIREQMANELFQKAGVPAARVAFYRLYVDYGEGPKYFGLYSLQEDPDGPMLDEQFKKDNGNLYKPEGAGADWTKFDKEGFVKKTNEDKADWSDVQTAVQALHADKKDAATWRKNLEKIFNVDGFVKWLAIATMMVHWDTYGSIAHNYYLYADPGDSGRIQWITWDHNMTFSTQFRQAPQLGLAEVDGKKWPLIRYIMDDPTYKALYNKYVRTFSTTVFDKTTVLNRMEALHKLISPYVVGKDGEQAGYTSLSSSSAFLESINGSQGLKAHMDAREKAIQDYLDKVD